MIDILPADPVKRGRIKMLALAAFFALPVVASYAVYFLDLAPGSTANYGSLLPPHPLAENTLQGIDGKPVKTSELQGKWLLVQFDSGRCAEYCERKLYFMRQVRKALGKDMSRVERIWLITDDTMPSERLKEAIEGTRLARTAGSPIAAEFPADRSAADHIYLVDPLGNLMMRFPRDPDPSKMLRDLQRLMKVSRIG